MTNFFFFFFFWGGGAFGGIALELGSYDMTYELPWTARHSVEKNHAP